MAKTPGKKLHDGFIRARALIESSKSSGRVGGNVSFGFHDVSRSCVVIS